VWNHDQVIRHNLIVLNRDAQVWGWFDVKDDRHWPADSARTNEGRAPNIPKPGDIAGAYPAKTDEDQPRGLTLEKLRLRFEGNVYFAAPGQGWFNWGTSWGRHKSYTSLREFQLSVGIDADSQVLDPGFADARQLDFRLPTEATSLLEQSYPQGPVPGVLLGVRR
jgi:hypothetical protein